MNFKLYEQVVYIPNHVLVTRVQDLRDNDNVEYGFIMSIPARNEDGSQDYFCRFWQKGELGVLRTTANSERTPGANLLHVPINNKNRVLQSQVIHTAQEILGLTKFLNKKQTSL